MLIVDYFRFFGKQKIRWTKGRSGSPFFSLFVCLFVFLKKNLSIYRLIGMDTDCVSKPIKNWQAENWSKKNKIGSPQYGFTLDRKANQGSCENLRRWTQTKPNKRRALTEKSSSKENLSGCITDQQGNSDFSPFLELTLSSLWGFSITCPKRSVYNSNPENGWESHAA